MSLRDAILIANDRPIEAHNVPEWGVTVNLRAMSVADRLSLVKRIKDGDVSFSEILIRCIVNDSGQREFNDADGAVFDDKLPAPVDRLGKRAMEMSALGQTDTDASEKN